ncbi:hypothetical protein PAN31117_03068 [Pandoraea anapnoica]|uniref:DUF2501 domain-containing protein n=1 Tax=Pandoraea anapnoica TaxID=2508301 RepID=A0A5E5A6X3_9BURK|nr:DUF2501 domain-containing protein [Pandoraea anapnoica]VVE68807.1 hypothetical protein PAN31117_03068 [Pandoraea anapnoica]
MSRRMECKASPVTTAGLKRWAGVGAASVALVIAAGMPIAAHAQLDLLKNAVGGSNSGGGDSGGLAGSLGGLASGGGGSLTSSSIGNATGVLQFCIKNNYLGGANLNSATDVKDKLLGKIGTQSGSPAASPGYLDGAKGLLSSPDGKTVDLNGGGLKEQLTRKVCDKVLDQAKSFL